MKSKIGWPRVQNHLLMKIKDKQEKLAKIAEEQAATEAAAKAAAEAPAEESAPAEEAPAAEETAPVAE